MTSKNKVFYMDISELTDSGFKLLNNTGHVAKITVRTPSSGESVLMLSVNERFTLKVTRSRDHSAKQER